MDMNEHSARREDVLDLAYRFRSVLFDAAAERGKRSGIIDTPGGPVREWMLYEEQQMLTVVNEERSRRSAPPATLEQVQHANSQAEGHCDYGAKFALYCAEIALGIQWTTY